MNDLSDGEIVLRLQHEVAADPPKGWLKAYIFDILLADRQERVGRADIRIGYTTSIALYGGHIGYTITEKHRGNRYAAKACKLLLSVAKQHNMDVIWITCDPDNYASRRTCEIAGAEFVEIVDLPPDNDQCKAGGRQKRRYRLIVY